MGRSRSIVATRTQKEAAAALGLSVYSFRNWATDTGNEEEIALATSEPGQVFGQSNRSYESQEWIRVDSHHA